MVNFLDPILSKFIVNSRLSPIDYNRRLWSTAEIIHSYL